MNCKRGDTMIVKYKPVCSKCNHVFDDLKVYKIYSDVISGSKEDIKLPKVLTGVEFEPKICPICKELIDGLEINNPDIINENL